ncbi:hypothetical protein E3N88_40015 [Mikania micrantha]|uniref:Tubby-like F-box protein n=1 Tax=Mikania micrantha TaxID=192012 RepID=A0A5N6LNN1_9ASTR|nr:hypothetical protein E3N88_40015 [Mikania micrantha]
MSFRSIVRDVRDGFGSLSRRSFDVRLTGLHNRGKSQGSVNDINYNNAPPVIQNSRWANLPPELLCDVIKRLEESESTWPERKHVVACAAVCKSWRRMCKEIVRTPESCGKLTFPVSLKQPGPRDHTIQCYIKRDKSNLTYHLFLCLNPAALLAENGKFLLSAKRTRRTTCTEYVISMDADNISRSSNLFSGTKFIIYDTQPPHSGALIPDPGRSSRRFYSKKVSPKVPNGNYNIAHITYELNVLGTRGPRKMHCIMHSIPASALEPGGFVPGQPELILSPHSSLENSFRSISFSKSFDRSIDFSSSRFSDIVGAAISNDVPDSEKSKMPLLIAAQQPPVAGAAPSSTAGPSQAAQVEHDKVILQFGKIGKDMFTMDYRYPLSAFQAFAICLSSFDTKLACE